MCAFPVFYCTAVSGLSWTAGWCLSDADRDGCADALSSAPRAPAVPGMLAEPAAALCCCAGVPAAALQHQEVPNL